MSFRWRKSFSMKSTDVNRAAHAIVRGHAVAVQNFERFYFAVRAVDSQVTKTEQKFIFVA